MHFSVFDGTAVFSSAMCLQKTGGLRERAMRTIAPGNTDAKGNGVLSG